MKQRMQFPCGSVRCPRSFPWIALAVCAFAFSAILGVDDEVPMKVTAKWSDLGINGKHSVRDVWRQKDLGTFENEFSADIVRNGCWLLKITAGGQ